MITEITKLTAANTPPAILCVARNPPMIGGVTHGGIAVGKKIVNEKDSVVCC